MLAAGFKGWTAKSPEYKKLARSFKKKNNKKKKPQKQNQESPRVLPGNPVASPTAPSIAHSIAPGIAPTGVQLVGHGGEAARSGWCFLPLLSAFNLLKRTSYSGHLPLGFFPPYILRGLLVLFVWGFVIGCCFFFKKKRVSG